MTAALGVILDQQSNTQKFFGGGVVDMVAKRNANDNDEHTNDIIALDVSADRRTVVSGQVGSAPVAFTWDSVTGEKKQRFKLNKGSRGVNAVALNHDCSLVALVDLHNDHNVYVYDANSGSLKMKDKGGPAKIFDVCFTTKAENTFASVGSKHIMFWDANTGKSDKGLFMKKGEMTSFACATYDNNGLCWTGGSNSQIYIWSGRELQQVIKGAHSGGFVNSIRHIEGKIYSGGKDGQVSIINASSFQVEKTLSFNKILIRSIDVKGTNALVGLRDGTVYEVDMNSGSKNAILESHCDGEVWGLAAAGDSHIITSGDDNELKAWNFKTRKCEQTGKISSQSRKAPKGGASSLTSLPDSQCARAVAFNPKNGHVAVGHNDGTLTVRAGKDQLDKVIH